MRGAIIGLALALAVTASACENETELTADGVAEAGRGDGAETTEATEPPPETTTTEAPTTTTEAPTTTSTAKPAAAPAPTTTAKPKVATTTTTAKAKATTSCHSSYQGTCIPPDVSDADCYPGSGNGPWYVHENNVKVVGPDVFGLDADNDGIGCEA